MKQLSFDAAFWGTFGLGVAGGFSLAGDAAGWGGAGPGWLLAEADTPHDGFCSSRDARDVQA